MHCASQLKEALAEYTAAEDHLGESHLEPFVGRMHARCEMVDVTCRAGRWSAASAVAQQMLADVESLVEEEAGGGGGGGSVFPQVAPLLTTAAASLDRGGGATRALMERMYREAARRHAALGDPRQEALTWRKLLNSRRVSWGSPRDLRPPDAAEARAMRADVSALFGALRRMGRDDASTCSICLCEMSHEEGPPVDILECLHVFHAECARSIFERDTSRVSVERARPRHPDERLILTGACPLCRTEVSMCGKVGTPST